MSVSLLTSPSGPSTSIANSSPLLSLPPELLLLVIPHLVYPDALSLKHSSPHLYDLIDTSVRLKVAWLIARKSRGLDCPVGSCVLKTDAAFCASGGGEVRRIMERRRRHEECRKGRGCEVVEGRRCPAGSKSRKSGLERLHNGWMRWKNQLNSGGNALVVSLTLGFVMMAVAQFWMWLHLRL